MINNRLFNKPDNDPNKITKKDKSIFKDVIFPRCLTEKDEGTVSKYVNVFTLPQGDNLDSKCLHGLHLTNQNTCLPLIKYIAKGSLEAVKILNSGYTYYRHGNLIPQNLYLIDRNNTRKVFVDNMIYEENKYEDSNNKPFRTDMTQLAHTFLKILIGNNKLDLPSNNFNNTFEIYHFVKSYYTKNNIAIHLAPHLINLAGELKEDKGKAVTVEEYEFKLRKSVFNLIFRLMCTGTNPVNQFIDVDQALNHPFFTDLQDLKGISESQIWESTPADF